MKKKKACGLLNHKKFEGRPLRSKGRSESKTVEKKTGKKEEDANQLRIPAPIFVVATSREKHAALGAMQRKALREKPLGTRKSRTRKGPNQEEKKEQQDREGLPRTRRGGRGVHGVNAANSEKNEPGRKKTEVNVIHVLRGQENKKHGAKTVLNPRNIKEDHLN